VSNTRLGTFLDDDRRSMGIAVCYVSQGKAQGCRQNKYPKERQVPFALCEYPFSTYFKQKNPILYGHDRICGLLT
jgi:hypothetical protein